MRGWATFTQDRSIPMTDEAMSPLRRRMIEDMTIRKLAPKTQEGYVRTIKDFAVFLGRSPGTASFEDVRRFQLHLVANGAGTPILNHTVSALRFFFRVTLKRYAVVEHTTFVHQPRKLPVVLSPEEIARLLNAAPGLKYKAALSVAYGAGLRAAEVVSLKICDIDSKRMIIRVEQGKGHKDRNVMLSASLLELLRAWWRARLAVSRPRSCPADDHTPAQSRLPCRRTGGRDREECVSTHAPPQLRHPSAGAERRRPGDPGPARSRQAGQHRALYAGGHKDDPARDEPAREHRAQAQRASATRLKCSACAASGFGGRGYLPRPWPGMATRQCRPCEPRPDEGHVGDRKLPHGGAGRACHALRGLCLHHHCLQQLSQPALSEVPR